MINQLQTSLQKLTASSKPAAAEDLTRPEPDHFAQMELDETEIEACLREGRKRKYFQQRNQTYWQQVLQTEETYRSYTAEELDKELLKTPVAEGKPFAIDDQNRDIVRLLCYYFTSDPRFEAEGYSLQKGLLLQGPVGVGKSLLMHLLQQNQHQSYRVVSALDIVNQYTQQGKDEKRTGANVLAVYFGNLPAALGSNPFGHRQVGFCFDDVGIEETRAMNFGTVKNCMEEILWKRYEARLFTSTHITTNLGAAELRDLYGPRIYDRMREMFNQITWPVTAHSRRG